MKKNPKEIFMKREKDTIFQMVKIYCGSFHGKNAKICKKCNELATYASEKIDKCVFGVRKPVCKKCVIHCFDPQKRELIRSVMRYAGPRMIFKHPIIALRHIYRKFFIKTPNLNHISQKS